MVIYSWINNYLTGSYHDRSHQVQLRAGILSKILMALFMLAPSFMIISVLSGTTLMRIICITLIFIAVLTGLVFLKLGKYTISAHILIGIILVAAWGILFFDPDFEPLSRLDTVVFVIGLQTVCPLIVNKKGIIFYGTLNFIIFQLFCWFFIPTVFELPKAQYLDYMTDNSFALLFVTLIGYLVYSINERSLNQAKNEARKNSEQYTHIKELHESISITTEKLETHSSELSLNAADFSKQSQDQASSVEEVSATSEEILAGINNVNTSIEKTNASLNSLMDKIKSLSSEIRDVSLKTGSTQDLTKSIAGVAQKGHSMLSTMAENLRNVRQSSGMMTGIIEMIGDISDQTNLLSLNAAIEAARAGEYGRGFAVVADQISKLADQTSSSIQDISNLIQTITSEISQGLSTVDETANTIKEIVDGVNTLSESVASVADLMEKQSRVNQSVTDDTVLVTELSDSISIAVEEQKTAMIEMTNLINGLSEISQNFAAGSNDIQLRSHDMKEMVHGLRNLVS